MAISTSGLLILVLVLVLIQLVIISLIVLYWFRALLDCINHEKDKEKKLIWLLVILFGGLIGAILYKFIRVPERMKEINKRMDKVMYG